MKTITKIVTTPDETESIGILIGKNLRGGECIELISDLGGGKTTFVRGLAEGAGSRDIVSSPTFTIGKQYTAGDKTIYHYDFYRLPEPGLIAEELQEALEDNLAVIVIEWSQSVREVLPEHRIVIEIMRQAAHPDHRQIILTIPDKYSYLQKAVA